MSEIPASIREKRPIGEWGKSRIKRGSRKRMRLVAGERFTGINVSMPLMVWRGKEDGPVVGITAAVNSDEIYGTGAIQRLIQDTPFKLIRGALILVPVVIAPSI